MTKEEFKKEVNNLQSLNKEKNDCKIEFKKSEKAFKEDGKITKNEQKSLDSIQSTILKIEKAIEEKRLKLLTIKEDFKSKNPSNFIDLGETKLKDGLNFDDYAGIPEDISPVESSFLAGIQNWCQTIRHTINEFEKEINSGDANQTDFFGLIVFKEVLNKFVGKYDLVSELGIELFIKIVNELEGKKNDENKVSLRDIAHAWDDKITTFQKDVSLHQKMFQKFMANRPNVNEGKLLEEIAYWPKGGVKALPQENAIQKAMLEVWMKSLDDEFFDTSTHVDLDAGFIYLKATYVVDDATGKLINYPVFSQADIDDLENQKALDLFKKLWKNKSILATPLDIEIYVILGEGFVPNEIKAGRINGHWELLDYNFAKKQDALKAANLIINDRTFWSSINVNSLILD